MPLLCRSPVPLALSEPQAIAISEKENQRGAPILTIERTDEFDAGLTPKERQRGAPILNIEHTDEFNAGLTLQERIRRALGEHLGVAPERIRTQHNKEKYCDTNTRNNPTNAAVGPELQEVLQLMKGLNETALHDDRIASASDGSGGFRETLARTARDVARHFDGKEFLYVELGPEPTKTVFLIQELLRHGAQIRRYVAVDINPASKRVMREALSGILEKDRIHHELALFEEFRVDDVREDRGASLPALVTTLGFQEGNEDPSLLPALYNRMLGPGDLLLSEMQLRPDDSSFSDVFDGSSEHIQTFYHHPYMRRFSRIAWERVFGRNLPSRGRFALVRVGHYAEQDLWAAVLYESPWDEQGSLPNHSSVPEVFVTNYCLKYSRHQFQKLRESSACSQKILTENSTGDSSVMFQLSLLV